MILGLSPEPTAVLTATNETLPMADSLETSPVTQLQIAHVLLLDVVGYSKLAIDDQREILQRLNQIIRDTNQVRAAEAAGKLIRIPTGDGAALVFSDNPQSPVQCAVEISQTLQTDPEIKPRMGIP